jgi:3-phenylpropionate/cinnamic acid dioxygenase small subunit
VTTTLPTVPTVPSTTRVRAGDPLHHELVETLEDEAALLDRSDIMAWLGVLAPDVVYRMPVRVTRMRDDPEETLSSTMFHFDENFVTLATKVSRMATTASPWAENPPSRTRRFLTSIKVNTTPDPQEYAVTASILLVRSRYDESQLGLITADRHDLWRRTDEGWRLARRDIHVDQSTLGLANLAIFL